MVADSPNSNEDGSTSTNESIVIVDDDMVEEAKTAGEQILAGGMDSPVANVGKTGKRPPSVPSFTMEEEMALAKKNALGAREVTVGIGNKN